ncbi:unnamed protein product, partial [Durusdinium trenchii]
MSESHVKINVGGEKFIAVRPDLFNVAGENKLSTVFSGRWETFLDSDGAYFVDYSPDVFMPLINWLREVRDSNPDATVPVTVKDEYRMAWVKMMRALSFDLRILKAAGIKLADLCRAGFSEEECRAAHFPGDYSIWRDEKDDAIMTPTLAAVCGEETAEWQVLTAVALVALQCLARAMPRAAASFHEPPRRRDAGARPVATEQGPRAAPGAPGVPVPCAAWAQSHPHLERLHVGRPLHKMDGVAEEVVASTNSTPSMRPRNVNLISDSRVLQVPNKDLERERPVQEAKRISPRDSPLSPTRVIKSESSPLSPTRVIKAVVKEERWTGEKMEKERKLDESPPKNDRDTDLANKTAQLERDARDMLQQFQEFEREKEDEVREFHAEIAQLPLGHRPRDTPRGVEP